MSRHRRARGLALLAWSANAAALASPGEVDRLDERLDAILAPGVVAEKVVDGHVWVEGPAWSVAERALYFSDIPRNAVFRWSGTGPATLHLRGSGYSGITPFPGKEPGSNGLAFDREGRLVMCQHGDRRIVRREPDGALTVLADRYDGKRLNSPNDLVFRPGTDEIYFTDPPFGLPGAFEDPARELPWSGVYRRRGDGVVELLSRELGAPNGIAFSPDGRTLYVSNADAARPVWTASAVAPDGSIGPARVLADATRLPRPEGANPDGIEIDRDGNLFTAGPGGLVVIASDGTFLGVVETGVTSNAEWGDDGRTLYVTADQAIWRIRTRTGRPETAGSAGASEAQRRLP